MKLDAMDPDKVAQVLQATLDPSHREMTEKHLQEFHKIVGFTPTLLHVVMSQTYELPVRQAGVIYLKNMVTKFWADPEVEEAGEPLQFNIHENDRQTIRQAIVEAIIHAPEPIRVQLCVCISVIIKYDYPGKFDDVGNKIEAYIRSPHHAELMGALMCLHQFVKNYEYKLTGDRTPLNEPMKHLLPIIYDRCAQLMSDVSDVALLLQKQVLKIFFVLTQNHLPLELITRPVLTQWIQMCRELILKPIQPEVQQIDKDDLPEQPCWKLKKWALHIIARLSDKFGSPGNVTSAYEDFAQWYLKSFSNDNVCVVLKVLELYRQQTYVSPRLLQLSLDYLCHGIKHAYSWKFIKPYIHTIIQEVVFPLMCHSEDDDELWESDPVEYIRVKFDIFEDFLSPAMAAQTLLHSVCSKRKDILQKTMGFCMQIMTSANTQPKQKDGALHILGSVADVVLKRKVYRDQAEVVLTQHVFPEFTSPHGYLRAKACWVLHYFGELRYQNETTLVQATELAKNLLCHDSELPVKVEAAIAIQTLVSEQEAAQAYLVTHLEVVVKEILNLIRETEIEDMTNALQKIVMTYSEEITPLAIELTTHLTQLFCKLVGGEDEENDDDDGTSDRTVAALGLMTTMDTLAALIAQQSVDNGTHTLAKPDPTVLQLEEIVLTVVGMIFQKHIIDFYEEVMGLIYNFTTTHISNRMWQVYRMIYEAFETDAFDFFTDMMSALHNYVTVDTTSFASNPEHLEIIYNMCKKVMDADAGEDAECHAAKLLEVIILQYRQLSTQVIPLFVQLALTRLTKEVKTSELRTMCLEVVIAALYVNTDVLFHTLTTVQISDNTGAADVIGHFLKQWIKDTNCFVGLHDRKLGILGLCTLLNLGLNRVSQVVEIAPQILPACLVLFSGIEKAYAAKAQDDADDDDESDDEEYDDNETSNIEDDPLDDEHDALDDEEFGFADKHNKSSTGEEGSEDEEDFEDECDSDGELTALESYETALEDEKSGIDEYVIFKTLLQGLESTDPAWYSVLVNSLNDDQRKQFQQVFQLADQRKAAADSKKIEEEGGYKFAALTIPNSFNFGGQS